MEESIENLQNRMQKLTISNAPHPKRTATNRRARLAAIAFFLSRYTPSGTLRYGFEGFANHPIIRIINNHSGMLNKVIRPIRNKLKYVNGGRLEPGIENFYSTRNGDMYELRGQDKDFYAQSRSGIVVPISKPGPLTHDLTQNTSQRATVKNIVKRNPRGLQYPGSFSVESDSIRTLRKGVYMFKDHYYVSITRFYHARMLDNDPLLVLPENKKIALIRWSSTLPSKEGTAVPSISTHTWSGWTWHRPYKLVILPEPGTRLIPIDKHYMNHDFMEVVLMPGMMKLIRKLDDGSYLVHYSTPYDIGFGIGPDNRTHVLMATGMETVKSEMAAQSISVEGLIPAI